MGSVAATWTSDTISGSASRFVINHADAELYIHPPMFETSVAIQMTVNVTWRNGLHGECPTFVSRAEPIPFILPDDAPWR